MLKLHITLFIIMLWSFSYSQQLTNYNTKNGLPSNHVYKISQDYNGFMWFATDKGLVKYNGSTFKTFTTKNGLTNNDVWGIHPTPDGKVWYLSKTSKLGYIKKDSIYTFDSENKNEVFNPNYSSQVNNKLILSNNIVSHHLENNKWKTLLKNYKKNSFLYLEHPKLIAIKTKSKEHNLVLVYKNGNKIEVKNSKNIINNLHFRGQLTDSLFYWSSNKEYSILNLNTSKIYRRTFKSEINLEKSLHTRINTFNNQIQITGRGFVGILDKNYNIKKTFFFPKNIDAHYAIIDKNESIWLSTFTNGIYYLPKAKQNSKYFFEGEKINSTNNINGKIIANIYNKGFYIYNSNTNAFAPYVKENDFLFHANYIPTLKTEYYTTKHKIIQKNKTKTKQINFSKLQIKTNETSKKIVFYQNYLFGNNSLGLNKLNNENLSIINEYQQIGINDILVGNDRLLIATTNGLKEFKNEKIINISFKNTLINKSILSIKKVSKTHFLLNTDGFGSFITDLKDIHQLKKSEFLIVNNAHVTNDNIWLATNSGILKYTKCNDAYKLKNTINSVNGLPTNQVNDVFVKDKEIIVSTNNGIVILPINQENKSQLINIFIDKIKYNNNTFISNKASLKYTNNNNISFSVSKIDFSENINNFSYSYKLEPVQNNFKTTKTSTINFNNLRPNTYKFKLKAENYQKEIEFTILPLWYQTIWFNILFTLTLSSLFFGCVWYLGKRYQLQKDKKLLQEKQLSEIQLKALRSQMNPHFVFNSLAAIQFYINENNYEASEKYLVKFSKLIRHFFELSKETNISLSEEIKLLTSYLEIEKLRFKEKLEFNINIDNNLDTKLIKIPTMLLQPIIENAVNHGIFNKFDTGTVTLNFNKIDIKKYKVTIIDNGVGFVNTKSRNKKIKSSNVLKERLTYLNSLEDWDINYTTEELYPEKKEKGNISTFIIKKR